MATASVRSVMESRGRLMEKNVRSKGEWGSRSGEWIARGGGGPFVRRAPGRHPGKCLPPPGIASAPTRDARRPTAHVGRGAADGYGRRLPFCLGLLLWRLIERAGGLGVALAAPVLLPAFSVVLGLPAGVKGGPAAALAEEKRTGVAHKRQSVIQKSRRSSGSKRPGLVSPPVRLGGRGRDETGGSSPPWRRDQWPQRLRR